MNARPASGAGLGFRRELIEPLKVGVPEAIRFFELAPENWAGMGGKTAGICATSASATPSSATDCRFRWAARHRWTRRCCGASAPSWPSTA